MDNHGALKAIDRKRICLYTPPFPGDTTMLTTIKAAAEFGVGGVELMNFCRELKTPDFETVSFLAGEARARDLEVPVLTVSINVLADPEGAAEQLKKYAKICAALGIPFLHHTVASDYRCREISEEEAERRFEACVPAVVDVCRFAESLGVKTLTENQGFVFNGAERLLALRERTGGKIGFVADVGNILFVDGDPAGMIRRLGGNILHAHLKDYVYTSSRQDDGFTYFSRKNRSFRDAEIGTGDIGFRNVFEAFDEEGYRGFFSLEFTNVADGNEARRVLERISY